MRSIRPMDPLHMRLGGLLVTFALLWPITAIDRLPDPLTARFPALGKDSAWLPLLLGLLAYPLLLFVLRRLRGAAQRIASFCGGLWLGLLPAQFYGLAHLLWKIPIALTAVTVRGCICGALMGALAAWYVPRSMRPRSGEW